MKKFATSVLMAAAFGAPAAMADVVDQVTYNINCTGSGLLPTAGSFTWDPDIARFTAFTVTWNGLNFDFAGPLGEANALGLGVPVSDSPPCIGGATGPPAAFALLTGACTPAPSGYFTEWHGGQGGFSAMFAFATVGVFPMGIEVADNISLGSNPPLLSSNGQWTVTPTTTSAPEPSSLLLATVSLFVLIARKRIPAGRRRARIGPRCTCLHARRPACV